MAAGAALDVLAPALPELAAAGPPAVEREGLSDVPAAPFSFAGCVGGAFVEPAAPLVREPGLDGVVACRGLLSAGAGTFAVQAARPRPRSNWEVRGGRGWSMGTRRRQLALWRPDTVSVGPSWQLRVIPTRAR
jgi:hypothetical protein